MTAAPEKTRESNRDLLIQSVVEMALPAHMMWLMAQSVAAEGYELRRDMPSRLSVAAVTPLRHLPVADRSLCAKRIDDVAKKILFDLAPQSQTHGMYCCAMFTLKLVDEGFIADPQSMPVLVAMLLIDDLKEEGNVGEYEFKEFLLRAEAGKLLSKAQKEGVYSLPQGRKL